MDHRSTSRTLRRPSVALVAVGLAVGVAACGDAYAAPDLDPAGAVELETTLAACAVGPDAGAAPLVDTLATGLEVPWGAVFLPDGRALFTERSGRIRVIGPGGLDPEPWADLEVYAHDEVGLMGIDLLDGPEPAIYVHRTVRSEAGGAIGSLIQRVGRRAIRAIDPERGHPTTIEVLRIPIEGDGAAGTPEVVVSGIPAFQLHGGGALGFGPDGMLYVGVGDAADHPTAQNPRSLRGKLLRYRPDGTVPADNPDPDSPVWALGLRNVQGFAWDVQTGALVAIDHGPSGMVSEEGRSDRDELNVVEPGANYGWPIVTGETEGGPWTSAVGSWTPAIAPAGIAIYRGPVEAWRGDAFVTGLRGRSLRRVEFDRSSGRPVARCEHELLSSDWGRLRLVREAPDGSVWVGTSNRDGRGSVGEQDDMILRLRPPAHAPPSL
jgi:glucose/arabinose dehydrogenase